MSPKLQGMTRRTAVAGTALGLAGAALAARAPGVLGQAKPFAGVRLNVAAFQHVHMNYLQSLLPEFEEATGMEVNFSTQAFPIYNQRADLELSAGGSSYDVMCISYVYASRWLGAGWFAPLDPFVGDASSTPPDWQPDDFDAGVQSAFIGAGGETYGYAWQAGAMLMAAARGDLLEGAGLAMPTTFDELGRAIDKVDGADGVKGYVSHDTHHWVWIPYLMAFGGSVFRDAPADLTPNLDTAEAAAALEYYAGLIRDHAPSGSLSYQDAQAMQAQLNGRANFRTQSIDWLTALVTDPKSRVRETVRYGLVPEGPAGRYPGVNSHGWGVPTNARQKEAGWEFIKWALSKETSAKLVEKGYTSVARRSVIASDLFRTRHILNGQDVGALLEETLRIGSSGYMRYRTVSVWPQVGQKLNKAVERVATGQQDGKAALAQAQGEIIADLRKSGVAVRI